MRIIDLLYIIISIPEKQVIVNEKKELLVTESN